MSESKDPASRGRPVHSPEHVAEMRARIVRSAQELFLSEGYGAVSMRRIAADVGCTVMTLYRYYDRKIDILRHLWGLVFSTLFDELEQVAKAESCPQKRLEDMALAYVQFWLDRREHYFMVFMSSNVEQADVSVFVANDASMNRFEIFQRCLYEAAGHDVPQADLATMTQLLFCTLNGIAQNLITISGYPWSSPQVLVRAAVRNLLGQSRGGAA